MADDDARYFLIEDGETEDHYEVVDKDDTPLGKIAATEDGWRAYDNDGDELPGGTVHASQHSAATALADHHDAGA